MAEIRTRAEIIDEMIEMSCEMQRLEAENEGLCARLATAEAERAQDSAIAAAGRAFFDAFVQTNGQAFPWMPHDLLTALVEDYDRRRAPSTGTTP